MLRNSIVNCPRISTPHNGFQGLVVPYVFMIVNVGDSHLSFTPSEILYRARICRLQLRNSQIQRRRRWIGLVGHWDVKFKVMTGKAGWSPIPCLLGPLHGSHWTGNGKERAGVRMHCVRCEVEVKFMGFVCKWRGSSIWEDRRPPQRPNCFIVTNFSSSNANFITYFWNSVNSPPLFTIQPSTSLVDVK